jgi:hypothetical protein
MRGYDVYPSVRRSEASVAAGAMIVVLLFSSYAHPEDVM